MAPEILLAGATMLALTAYSLTGGADFGGGTWDLLASGPRAKAQRRTIARAIGPIWEANHVWLIAVVVFTFVGFPKAFAVIATALHVPLTFVLIGIVLRGCAFVFRTYDSRRDEVQYRWSLLFAISSVLTPIWLGVALGAMAAGLHLDPATGVVKTDFISDWLRPFPFSVGLLTLTLWSFLAATYLTVDAEGAALKDDFRARALISAVLLGVLAFLTLFLARDGAPLLWGGLVGQWWSLPFHGMTALLAFGAIGALWTRRFRIARAFAAAQGAFVLWGWAWAQFPHAVPPELTFTAAAAPPSVLWPMLGALAAGGALIGPSFWLLFRVFKREEVPGGPSFENDDHVPPSVASGPR